MASAAVSQLLWQLCHDARYCRLEAPLVDAVHSPLRGGAVLVRHVAEALEHSGYRDRRARVGVPQQKSSGLVPSRH